MSSISQHLNDFLLSTPLKTISCHQNFYHLIILNSPCISGGLITRVWKNSHLKICADGGANRLFHSVDERLRKDYLPNAIIGDLDSLDSNVRNYYSGLNVPIIQDPDQDSHDLDKSLKLLKESVESSTEFGGVMNTHVIIIGGTGGRVDQEIAVFNTLYSWRHLFPKIIILDEISVVFLLSEGVQHHIIPIREGEVFEGRYCGLVPLGNPVKSITTTGLVWNLSGEPLEFGKRISTSNSISIDQSIVTIISSDPILWTVSWKLE